MELHLGMRQAWPPEPQIPYQGITMVDEAGGQSPMFRRRLLQYQQYVERGGVLSEEDYQHLDLIEEE